MEVGILPGTRCTWRGIAPRGASFKEHVQLLRGAQSRSEAFSPSSARSRRRWFNELAQVGGRLIAVRTLGQEAPRIVKRRHSTACLA